MSSKLEVIRVLSDGRPGHQNQTVGLAEALGRRTGARVDLVRVTGNGYLRRYRAAAALDRPESRPQLLIGAGHATHLPLLFAARQFAARSVVVMKPTWPIRWFDLCLVPAHDFRKSSARGSVLLTRGALNRIPEVIPPKARRGLMLVGGPSKHHGWRERELRAAIAQVISTRPDLPWTIGDSPRTPAGFLDRLRVDLPGSQLVSWRETDSGWVPAQLLAAEEAWVTEDSISMVHEAVTAGARTGVLPMPAKHPGSRVLEAVRSLVADGCATAYANWRLNGGALPPPRRLHETARCAEYILTTFFPDGDGSAPAG